MKAWKAHESLVGHSSPRISVLPPVHCEMPVSVQLAAADCCVCVGGHGRGDFGTWILDHVMFWNENPQNYLTRLLSISVFTFSRFHQGGIKRTFLLFIPLVFTVNITSDTCMHTVLRSRDTLWVSEGRSEWLSEWVCLLLPTVIIIVGVLCIIRYNENRRNGVSLDLKL
jgi:hypothetical protein